MFVLIVMTVMAVEMAVGFGDRALPRPGIGGDVRGREAERMNLPALAVLEPLSAAALILIVRPHTRRTGPIYQLWESAIFVCQICEQRSQIWRYFSGRTAGAGA